MIKVIEPVNAAKYLCPVCKSALVATKSELPTDRTHNNGRRVHERLYMTCPKQPSHTGLKPIPCEEG